MKPFTTTKYKFSPFSPRLYNNNNKAFPSSTKNRQQMHRMHKQRHESYQCRLHIKPQKTRKRKLKPLKSMRRHRSSLAATRSSLFQQKTWNPNCIPPPKDSTKENRANEKPAADSAAVGSHVRDGTKTRECENGTVGERREKGRRAVASSTAMALQQARKWGRLRKGAAP